MKVRPNIETLLPYVPGKPIEELERELGIHEIIKLASNENPLGPSPRGVEAARRALEKIQLYPDGSGYRLRHAIADRHGVSASQVVIGNGSNDVLELVARTFACPGDEIVYAEFSFVVYRLVTQAIGAIGVEVPAKDYGHDLDAIAAAVTPKTRIIFLANPNNPTGTMFDQKAWDGFLKKVPEEVLVVVDEAYAEYVNDPAYPDPWKDLAAGRNLAITRTFSKIFGLAGLRMGYAVTRADLADYMNRVRQPFNVNSAAQEAALAALKDADFIRRSQETNVRGLHFLARHLAGRGLKVTDSWGNFVMADLGREARPVYEALLRKGVIIRPLAGYGLPHHVRITVGTSEDLQFLAKALDAALQETA